MKSFAKIWLVLVTVATMAAYTTYAQADSSGTNTPPAAAKTKPKGKRYMGTITSVDSAAKTITVTSASGVTQTIHVSSKTRIKKDGQPATFADAAAGLKISGTERPDESTNWVASTINIGETKAKTPPPAAAAPADTK